jgi:hypothetical protein
MFVFDCGRYRVSYAGKTALKRMSYGRKTSVRQAVHA